VVDVFADRYRPAGCVGPSRMEGLIDQNAVPVTRSRYLNIIQKQEELIGCRLGKARV